MTKKTKRGVTFADFMNAVLGHAARQQAMWERFMLSLGHKTKTTFFGDLTIAEVAEGRKRAESALRNTHKNVLASWLDNIEYITEYSMAVNHKIGFWFETWPELARVYDELWRDVDARIIEHYKNDEAALAYYYETTD